MSLTVVDLPEPLGPRRPKTSPRRTSKSTLSTARALERPQKSLKTLVRPWTETTVELEEAMRVRIADCGLRNGISSNSEGRRPKSERILNSEFRIRHQNALKVD